MESEIDNITCQSCALTDVVEKMKHIPHTCGLEKKWGYNGEIGINPDIDRLLKKHCEMNETEEILIFKLENDADKEFIVKPMPNAKELNYHIKELIISWDGKQLMYKYFLYAYVEGKLRIIMVGKIIRVLLLASINGYYADMNGIFLAREKENIVPLNIDEVQWNDAEPIMPEYKYIEPFNPYDLREKKWISFEIKRERGIIKFDRLRWIDLSPIWNPGDSKEKIESMYDELPTLDEAIARYMEKLKIQNPNVLFGIEARQAFYKWEQTKLQNF